MKKGKRLASLYYGSRRSLSHFHHEFTSKVKGDYPLGGHPQQADGAVLSKTKKHLPRASTKRSG